MYCKNCGKKNDDGDKYCDNCGTPQYQPSAGEYGNTSSGGAAVVTAENPPATSRKPRKALWIVLAAAAALIIVVILCFNTIIFWVSPSLAVTKATVHTGSMLNKRVESSTLNIFKILISSAYNGKLGTEFSFDSTYGEASGNISVSYDSSGKNYAIATDLTINGTDFDLTALINKDRLALQSSLIDDQYYGVTYETFGSDIKSFADIAGLDDYSIEMLTNIVDSIDQSLNTDHSGLYAKFAMPLASFIAQLKYNTSRETITVNGDNIGCAVVTYTITKDDLIGLLEDFYTLMSTDDDIRDYITSTAFNSTYASYSLPYNYIGEDAESLYEDLLSGFEDAINSVKEEYSGTIDFSYYLKGRSLVRFELEAEPDVLDYEASLGTTVDFGKDPSKDDIEITFYYEDEYSSLQEYSIKLESENSGGVKRDTLILGEKHGDTVTLKSRWNTETGALTLLADDGYMDHELAGNLTMENDSFCLEFSDLEAGYNGRLDLTITAETGADIPEPSYINLDKWDEDLIDKAEDAVEELLNS